MAAAGHPERDQLHLHIDVYDRVLLGQAFKLTVWMYAVCVYMCVCMCVCVCVVSRNM